MLDRQKSQSFSNLPTKSLCLEIPARLPPRVPIYYSCSSNQSSLTADSNSSNSLQTKFKPILSKFTFSQTAKSLYNNLLPKFAHIQCDQNQPHPNSLNSFNPHKFKDKLLNEVS